LNKNEPTKRQKEILGFIYNSIETNGFPPSLQDFNNKFGFKSNQAIIDHLKALEQKKLIKREEGSARGLKILPFGYQAIKKQPLMQIAGATAAGSPIQMIEKNEWVAMPSGHRKYDDVFIVEINGNSMIEAGIYDGDKVLIKKSEEYKTGDIVLARIADEVTLKTFIHEDGRVYLKPANPACRNIAITHETYFLGKYIKNLGAKI
jgi:repressor LexA